MKPKLQYPSAFVRFSRLVLSQESEVTGAETELVPGASADPADVAFYFQDVCNMRR